MADKKEIKVTITADSKQAEKSLNKTADAISGLGSSASSASSKLSGASGVLEQMAGKFRSLTSSIQNMRKNLSGIDSNGLKKVANDVKNVDNNTRKATSSVKGFASQCSKMSGAINAIAAIEIGGVFANMASGLLNMGIASVQAAAQMRQYEIAFQTMLKSAEGGTQMLRELQQFAADTPFDVPGVVSAGQQLMAFGFKANEVIPMLTSLGDAASGLGLGSEGVSRLAYALGQMQTSGKLNSQDMMQLTSAGIAAWDMLAEKAGLSVAEMKELCSQGAIDSKAAVETIVEGMNAQFGGMMDKTSTEVTGLMSNIQETVGTTSVIVGDYLTKAFGIKDILQETSDSLGTFQKNLQKAVDTGGSIKDAIKESFSTEAIVACTAAAGALAAVFAILAAAVVAAVGTAVVAVTGISAAIAGVVVAVGAAIALICMYFDEIVDTVTTVAEGIYNANVLAFSKIAEVVLSVVQYIAGLFGDLWGTVTGYHNNWFNDFASMLGDALSAVQSFAQSAISWFASVFAAKNKALADTVGGTTAASELEQIQQDDAIYQSARKAQNEDKQKRGLFITSPTGGGVSSGRSGGGGGGGLSQENAALKAAQEENRIAQERLKIENNYAKQKLKKEKELFTAQNALAKQYGTERQKYELELAEIEFNKKQSLANENLSFQEQMLSSENALKEAYLKGAAKEEIELLEKKKQLLLDTHQATLDTINAAATASTNAAMMKYDNSTAAWQAQYNTSSGVDQMTMSNEKWRENAIADANQMTDYQEKLDTLTAINQKYEEQKEKIGTINKLQQSGLQLAKDFSAGIADWVTGAQTFGDAMKSVLKSLIAQLIQAAMYALILASLGIGAGGSFVSRFVGNFGKGFARGGEVDGDGTSTSDSIPAMLSNGEYVLNADAVDRLGVPFLNGLNTGRLMGFATGGLVGSSGGYKAESSASAGGASNRSVTLNVSAIDASGFSDFLARGGMQVLKQAMLDDNRNFNAAFETF